MDKHMDAIDSYIRHSTEEDYSPSELIEKRIADAINFLLIFYTQLVGEGKLPLPLKLRNK